MPLPIVQCKNLKCQCKCHVCSEWRKYRETMKIEGHSFIKPDDDKSSRRENLSDVFGRERALFAAQRKRCPTLKPRGDQSPPSKPALDKRAEEGINCESRILAYGTLKPPAKQSLPHPYFHEKPSATLRQEPKTAFNSELHGDKKNSSSPSAKEPIFSDLVIFKGKRRNSGSGNESPWLSAAEVPAPEPSGANNEEEIARNATREQSLKQSGDHTPDAKAIASVSSLMDLFLRNSTEEQSALPLQTGQQGLENPEQSQKSESPSRKRSKCRTRSREFSRAKLDHSASNSVERIARSRLAFVKKETIVSSSIVNNVQKVTAKKGTPKISFHPEEYLYDKIKSLKETSDTKILL